MPVELLHAVIAATFLTVWVVVSQIAFSQSPEQSKQRSSQRATDSRL